MSGEDIITLIAVAVILVVFGIPLYVVRRRNRIQAEEVEPEQSNEEASSVNATEPQLTQEPAVTSGPVAVDPNPVPPVKLNPVPPVKPEIDHIDPGIADHTALVWNKVKVVMKQDGDFTYSIGDISQTSPEFNGIKPGSYTVTVKNADGVTATQPLVLKDIKKLDPPLTIQQVQDIFDKVSSGKMSASTAQDKLAGGNVNLSKTIQPGDIKTLWGALMEAAMGERFKVNSFDNDPNTNKIKSGSLSLSKK